MTLDDYLALPYTCHFEQDGDGTWFAKVLELDGCMTTGYTFEDAVAMLADAKRGWLKSALRVGMPIPLPTDAD